MMFIYDNTFSSHFKLHVMIIFHAPSTHLSETGALTSHSVSIVTSSPAPTSTTHSKRPSFFPPFPSTTLLHRTVRFSLPALARPSPSPLPSRPLCSTPTLSSSPCSSSARPSGRRRTTLTRFSSSDTGTPSRSTSARSANGWRFVTVVRLRYVVAAHCSENALRSRAAPSSA